MEEKEVIDRDTYRKIKKMDREALTKFILQYGDELLEREYKAIDLDGMKAELLKLKGFGNKRVEEVMTIVKQHIKK